MSSQIDQGNKGQGDKERDKSDQVVQSDQHEDQQKDPENKEVKEKQESLVILYPSETKTNVQCQALTNFQLNNLSVYSVCVDSDSLSEGFNRMGNVSVGNKLPSLLPPSIDEGQINQTLQIQRNALKDAKGI